MPRRSYQEPDEQLQAAPSYVPHPVQYAEPQREENWQAAQYAQYAEPRAPQRAQIGNGREAPQRQEQQHYEQPAEQRNYLAAHAVEKSFGDRKVVKGASLYVRRGEAVGLLGPNGAGKTTIFYMITGLIAADRGRIELDGHDVTTLPMYQRARLGIGYLPQEASIFRGLTVEENIRAVLEVVEPNKAPREHDLDALLEEFNITQAPQVAVDRAVRRRAAALRDRARAGLAAELHAARRAVRRHRSDRGRRHSAVLVRHLTNRGIGVLITDHNVRETLGLTDRAYIIYSGEVLMEGRTDDIVNNPEVRRLYLGEEFRL